VRRHLARSSWSKRSARACPPWRRRGSSRRHRGGHDRGAPRPRRDRSAKIVKFAAASRSPRLDARQPAAASPPSDCRLAGVPGNGRRTHRRALQRRRRARWRRWPSTARRRPRSSSKSHRREHGSRRPQEGFLRGVRDRRDPSQRLLVFDEVITDSVSVSAVLRRLRHTPDLSIFGKVIGAGSRSPRSVARRCDGRAPPLAPCTRRARFPGTRSPPRPVSPSSDSSTTRRTRRSNEPRGPRRGTRKAFAGAAWPAGDGAPSPWSASSLPTAVTDYEGARAADHAR